MFNIANVGMAWSRDGQTLIAYILSPLENSEYSVNAHDVIFSFSDISGHDVAQAINQMNTTKVSAMMNLMLFS